MIHVLTVHFRDPRWIPIQERYLREHLPEPFETWASIEGIQPPWGEHFDHVFDQGGGHAGKLNHLAVEATNAAHDEDLLMFLDGDAFPIANPMPVIEEGLAQAPLVAVRRAENGDLQPHPCFCVTSVKTWCSLPGDWSMGYRWTADDGSHPTDVGGNLLRVLALTKTPWVDLLRTNPVILDPLYFAIYGDVIYHHGSGFRRGGASRAAYRTRPRRLGGSGPRALLRPVDSVRRGLWRLRVRRPQISASARVFATIRQGGDDWLAAVRGG